MKNYLIKYFLILTLLFPLTFSFAQEEKKASNMYSVHVDPVKPSMYQEYEELLKEFVAFLKENDVKDFNYLTFRTEELKYYHVSHVEKWADYDSNPLAEISDKEQQQKLSDLMAKMDKCYDVHGNYMIHLNADLTYMPDGFSQGTPGEPYRIYYMHHYDPSEKKAIYEAAKALKQLHVEKQSKTHYRVYQSGFGVVGSYLLFAISAKDPVDLANKSKANWELMGEEFGKAINNLYKHTSKTEVERAWNREDLGYQKQ